MDIQLLADELRKEGMPVEGCHPSPDPQQQDDMIQIKHSIAVQLCREEDYGQNCYMVLDSGAIFGEARTFSGLLFALRNALLQKGVFV